MKSWEVLRDAADKVGVKALAARLNLSTALVYKWCQEAPQDDPGASGARNPLDRLREIYELTQDEELIRWICMVADGSFVPNPHVEPGEHEEQLLSTTQRVVEEFGNMLTTVSRSIENDGQITDDEADRIRRSWERLKSQAERFVIAAERGLYRRKKGHRE
ncbi:MAG: phage regulatory CII family protein [Phycisphaerae bacterium]